MIVAWSSLYEETGLSFWPFFVLNQLLRAFRYWLVSIIEIAINCNVWIYWYMPDSTFKCQTLKKPIALLNIAIALIGKRFFFSFIKLLWSLPKAMHLHLSPQHVYRCYMLNIFTSFHFYKYACFYFLNFFYFPHASI